MVNRLVQATVSVIIHLASTPSTTHVDQGKVEESALPSRIRIHIPDQSGQFSQGRILPRVYLQLVRWHFSVGVLADGMMASCVAKHPEEQGTSLKKGQEILF